MAATARSRLPLGLQLQVGVISTLPNSLVIPGCICHRYNHGAELPACPHPSSTGVFVVYHRRGRDPGDGDGDLWPHVEKRQRVRAGPAGCFPSLRPSLCITRAAEAFPASLWGWLA